MLGSCFAPQTSAAPADYRVQGQLAGAHRNSGGQGRMVEDWFPVRFDTIADFKQGVMEDQICDARVCRKVVNTFESFREYVS